MTGLGGAATLRGHMPPEWAAELEGFPIRRVSTKKLIGTVE